MRATGHSVNLTNGYSIIYQPKTTTYVTFETATRTSSSENIFLHQFYKVDTLINKSWKFEDANQNYRNRSWEKCMQC